MADVFLDLDDADHREARKVAAAASRRPVHLLEKDVWVVWLLDVLFRAPFGKIRHTVPVLSRNPSGTRRLL